MVKPKVPESAKCVDIKSKVQSLPLSRNSSPNSENPIPNQMNPDDTGPPYRLTSNFSPLLNCVLRLILLPTFHRPARRGVYALG
jgi:hypothetical protein